MPKEAFIPFAGCAQVHRRRVWPDRSHAGAGHDHRALGPPSHARPAGPARSAPRRADAWCAADARALEGAWCELVRDDLAWSV